MKEKKKKAKKKDNFLMAVPEVSYHQGVVFIPSIKPQSVPEAWSGLQINPIGWEIRINEPDYCGFVPSLP